MRLTSLVENRRQLRRVFTQPRLLLLTLVIAFGQPGVQAQMLEKITHLEAEYWRSFHGLIKIEVKRHAEGDLTLNYAITPANDQSEKATKRSFKKIKESDLAPVLEFFNFGDVRQFFATTPTVLQPDGADLSITATQNSFSLSFHSQYAFATKASRYPRAFGKIALHLFRLAEIQVPKDELY